MHCTVERDCFWDFPLCSPLWGRTLLVLAKDFVYMAQELLENTKLSSIIVSSFHRANHKFYWCNEKHYLWFSLKIAYTVCAFGMAAYLLLYNSRQKYVSVPYVLLCFVVYNVVEDLPMYLNRHAEKTHLHGYNIGIIDGALDAVTCNVVSQSSKIWGPQMLWQTLNYTTVPVASILFTYSVQEKKSKPS